MGTVAIAWQIRDRFAKTILRHSIDDGIDIG
jgi:hypothetical protein